MKSQQTQGAAGYMIGPRFRNMANALSLPSRPAKQRGVVLFFTLIALLVMSLAVVALIRSVDTGTMIANNLAFRQSATTAADAGIEAAIRNLTALNTANAALNVLIDPNHQFNITNVAVNPGYYSSVTALDFTNDTTWSGSAGNNSVCLAAVDGNTSCYIIQRMCRVANQPIGTAFCLFGTADEELTPQTIPYPQDMCQGAGCPVAGQTPQIRITVRTQGNRSSVSYVQAFVY